ncbi:MAG: trehalose-6-phosphate synthase [Candidatus Acidiferrales bacterium]
MRSNLRFILPLIASVALVSLLFAVYRAESEKRALRDDLTARAGTLGESLQEIIEPLVDGAPDRNLQRVVEKFGHRGDNLAGIAVYDENGAILAITSGLATSLRNQPEAATEAASLGHGVGEFTGVEGVSSEIYGVPLYREGQIIGTLALFYDTRSIDAQTAQTWHDAMVNAGIETILIVFITMFLIRWTFRDPLARTAVWLRAQRLGHRSGAPPAGGEMFDQLTNEAAHMAKNLDEARNAADVEARLRESGESQWTAERLRVSLRGKLQDSPLFVVSNREPYMHMRREKSIEVVVPASGVVTAIEPVMVSCDGTWIAQGSGTADREMVDARDHLRVPPETPSYTLRRLWLTPEEEKGFYFGFANEGIWPLCHTAFAQPIFRASDWEQYQRVNMKFADAVLQEMEHTEKPVVLVQDYHFALLPRLIKEARPDARVAIFWHIPWPNPEVFGICPWQRELLHGLLGADLIGFHTQFHCNNFLETVDRALEALTEWDRFAVNRQGHLTWIRPFPISVAFAESAKPPENAAKLLAEDENVKLRAAVFQEYGIETRFLGVGVDRADYTKGILERFRGIEQFLESYPAYRREFTFLQIATPSRGEIPAYHDLQHAIIAEANRINAKFQTARWKPIVILERHHTHTEIFRLFRAADVCMVTSLHDGMNLVAKEFVVAREDLRGVLILSHFTGASRELVDALLVNPYDAQQLADRIREALEMPRADQAARMERMRRVVREHNIYRWAGTLLTELCEIRVEHPERVERPANIGHVDPRAPSERLRLDHVARPARVEAS